MRKNKDDAYDLLQMSLEKYLNLLHFLKIHQNFYLGHIQLCVILTSLL